MVKPKQGPLYEIISSDNQWVKLLEKPQLIVVDVYSEWCGPCVAMVSSFKSILQQVGRDKLCFAIAQSDNITYLNKFKNKSEPTWLFLSDGKTVNIMYGANAPQLKKLIGEQLKLDLDIKAGYKALVTVDIESLPEKEIKKYIHPPLPKIKPEPEPKPKPKQPEEEIEYNYCPFKY